MFELFKQLKAEKLRTIGELEKEMVEVTRGEAEAKNIPACKSCNP